MKTKNGGNRKWVATVVSDYKTAEDKAMQIFEKLNSILIEPIGSEFGDEFGLDVRDDYDTLIHTVINISSGLVRCYRFDEKLIEVKNSQSFMHIMTMHMYGVVNLDDVYRVICRAKV